MLNRFGFRLSSGQSAAFSADLQIRRVKLSDGDVDFCLHRGQGSSVLVFQLSKFMLTSTQPSSGEPIPNWQFVLDSDRVTWRAVGKLIGESTTEITAASQTVQESLGDQVQSRQQLVFGNTQTSRPRFDLSDCGRELWTVLDRGLNLSLQIGCIKLNRRQFGRDHFGHIGIRKLRGVDQATQARLRIGDRCTCSDQIGSTILKGTSSGDQLSPLSVNALASFECLINLARFQKQPHLVSQQGSFLI